MSEERTHEVNEGCLIDLSKGSIVAIDRVHTDYVWYLSLSVKGIFPVVRLKSNEIIGAQECREVSIREGWIAMISFKPRVRRHQNTV